MDRLKYFLMDYDVRRKIGSVVIVTFVLLLGIWLSLATIKNNQDRAYPNKDRGYITTY